MELDIISYSDLLNPASIDAHKKLEKALLNKGIVGIKGVPDYERKARAYIDTAREFSALPEAVKKQYAPNREIGDTEGYEFGAEMFKDDNGEWQVDDKKISYYAFVPDHPSNKWPREIDLKTPYQELGAIIFQTGKLILNIIGLDESTGLLHDKILGYGRMLHYYKESDATNANPNWCGAHFDHSAITGLIPAYYFLNGVEIDEPEEAGLYIKPTNGNEFEKIYASDKSVLLFQVGEFGQLISNDRIRATKHLVKKAKGEIERYTFALFYDPEFEMTIKSTSCLTKDNRYVNNQAEDGSIRYIEWRDASFEQYIAK